MKLTFYGGVMCLRRGNEAVVNRFRGGCDDVAPRAEYPFGRAHG